MAGDIGDLVIGLKFSKRLKENTEIQKKQLEVLKEIMGLLKK